MRAFFRSTLAAHICRRALCHAGRLAGTGTVWRVAGQSRNLVPGVVVRADPPLSHGSRHVEPRGGCAARRATGIQGRLPVLVDVRHRLGDTGGARGGARSQRDALSGPALPGAAGVGALPFVADLEWRYPGALRGLRIADRAVPAAACLDAGRVGSRGDRPPVCRRSAHPVPNRRGHAGPGRCRHTRLWIGKFHGHPRVSLSRNGTVHRASAAGHPSADRRPDVVRHRGVAFRRGSRTTTPQAPAWDDFCGCARHRCDRDIAASVLQLHGTHAGDPCQGSFACARSSPWRSPMQRDCCCG